MTIAPRQLQPIGTISSVIERNVIESIENDGAHEYLHLQGECSTQLPVTSMSTEIRIPLTDVNVDATQFDKSFITIGVDIPCTFKSETPIWDYTTDVDQANPQVVEHIYKGCKIFVGLKHSSECIREYKVYHKGRIVDGASQDNATVEGFIYNTYKTEETIMNRKGCHTIWKSAHKDDASSICGTYVSLYDLLQAQKNGGKLTIPFTFTIPFNDIVVFNMFNLYHNAIFGQLELLFKFNPQALVYVQSEPLGCIYKHCLRNRTKEMMQLWSAIQAKLTDFPILLDYNYEYEQIGDPTTMINKIEITDSSPIVTLSKMTLQATGMRLHTCFTTIVGCKQDPTALEELRQEFTTEKVWSAFSQRVQYLPFTQSASSHGLSITQQTYLKNVTDYVLLFPRTERQVTVSKNPMLTDLSLTAMNKPLPSQPLDTSSERFAEMMLNASDIEYGAPFKEYANSVTIPRANENGLLYHPCDLTSFLVTIKVERPSAMGMVNDGPDSNGQSVPIRLKAKKKFDGESDDYCTKQPPPPVLVLISDTFWLFSAKDGGKCILSDGNYNDVKTAFLSGAI